MAGLDLAELVNAKVRGELPAMDGQLDELVRQAVDDEVGRRVRELVDAELESRRGRERADTKQRGRCRQVKPLDA